MFPSGQIGIKDGRLEEGLEAQLRQAFLNLETVLRGERRQLDDVLKITVYLADMGDYAEMNATYASFWAERGTTLFPARTCVEVGALPFGARIEIDAIATSL